MANEYDSLVDELFVKNNKEPIAEPSQDVIEAPTRAATQEPVQNYDAEVDETYSPDESKFKQAAFVAKQKDPERMAEAIKFSKQYNVPVNFAEKNLESFKAKTIKTPLDDYESILNKSPKLAKWMEDPVNATMAKDDIEILSEVENYTSRLRPRTKKTHFGSDLLRAGESGLNDLGAGSFHMLALSGGIDKTEAMEKIAAFNQKSQDLRENQPSYAKRFNEIADKEGGDVTRAFMKFANSFSEIRRGNVLQGLVDFTTSPAITAFETIDLIGKSLANPRSLTYLTTETAAASLPSILAGVAGGIGGTSVGGPLGGIIGAAGGTFAGGVATEMGAELNSEIAKKYNITDPQQLLEAYSDPNFIREATARARRKGITTAAFESIFAAFGGKSIAAARRAGKSTAVAATKEVLKEGAVEGLGEFAGQTAREKGDLSKTDIGGALFEGVISGGKSTATVATMTAARSGKLAVTSKLRKKYSADPVEGIIEIANDTQDALEAHTNADALKNIDQKVQELKNVNKAPGKLGELIKAVSEDQNVEFVYFQKDDIDNYWNENGQSPTEKNSELTGNTSPELTETEEHSDVIKVPIERLIEQAGDNLDALANIARLDPDGMNLVEAQEHIKELPVLVEEVAQEALNLDKVDSKKENLIPEEELKIVKKDIKEQLSQKMSATDADVQAQVYLERTRVRSELLGVSPLELHKAQNLKINFVNSVKDIPNAGQPGKTTTLKQSKSGQIRIGKNSINIDIFRGKNPTTFLHETGHLWLNEMTEDLKVITQIEKKTPLQEQFLGDTQTILDWLGVEKFEDVKKVQHEQFARGAEAFFMTGKAPTESLKKAFIKFRTWMVAAYKQMRNLNVKLTPEVEAVMVRLLAADSEVNLAGKFFYGSPLFADGRSMGMSESKAISYEQARLEAEDDAKNRMTNEVMADLKKHDRKFLEEKIKEETPAAEAEADKSRVYQALNALSQGLFNDGKEIKISIESAKRILGNEKYKELKKNTQNGKVFSNGKGNQETMDVDLLLDMFPYGSSEELLIEILTSPSRENFVESLAKQLVHQKYPDILTNEDVLEEMANEAIHTEKRERVLRMELEHLASNNIPVLKEVIRKVTRKLPSSKLIKQQAIESMKSKKIKDIRPDVFLRAEKKFAKNAGESLAKGDISGSFEFKRKELINHVLYKTSLEARESFRKNKEFIKNLNGSEKKIAKTRDINFVKAAKALISNYQLGTESLNTKDHLDEMSKYDPTSYSTVTKLIDNVNSTPKPFQELNLSEYNEIIETAKALWDLAKTSNEIIIEGKKITKEQALNEMIEDLQKFKKSKKTKEFRETTSDLEKTLGLITQQIARLKRFESWIDVMTLGDMEGSLRKYLFQPLQKSQDNLSVIKLPFLEAFRDGIKKLDVDNQPIISKELNFKFKNKYELLGMIVHIGNPSNYKKLILGYNWGALRPDNTLDDSRFKSFLNRMYDEGKITQKDMDFIQEDIWDKFEEIKPDAQKAHKKLNGFYFDEVTAHDVVTPFGTYKGGYAPAVPDPDQIPDQKIKQEAQKTIDEAQGGFLPYSGGDGFTKSRISSYAQPLKLDLRVYGSHIDATLKYIYIKPAVVDAAKLVSDKGFINEMSEVDQNIIPTVILPALNRFDKQQIIIGKDPNERGFDMLSGYLAKYASMQIFFGHIGNMLEQAGNFPTAFLKASPKNVLKELRPSKVLPALVEYAKNPKAFTFEMAKKSKYMKTEIENQTFIIAQETRELLNNPTKYGKAQAWGAKNAFIFQRVFQNVLNAPVWAGAYNGAIEEGKSEAKAVEYADFVIRSTMGVDNGPLNVAQIQSSQWLSLIQPFMGYFLNMMNLMAGEHKKNFIREAGLSEKVKKAFVIHLLTIATPAIVSTLVARGLSGSFDEDGDGELAEDFLDVFIGSQVKFVAAAIPVLGPAMVIAYDKAVGNDQFSSRALGSPALSVLSRGAEAAGGLLDIAKGDSTTGQQKKFVRDALNTIGVITRLPIGPLAKPIVYGLDVEAGNIEGPTGPIDLTRGLLSGKGPRR